MQLLHVLETIVFVPMQTYRTLVYTAVTAYSIYYNLFSRAMYLTILHYMNSLFNFPNLLILTSVFACDVANSLHSPILLIIPILGLIFAWELDNVTE